MLPFPFYILNAYVLEEKECLIPLQSAQEMTIKKVKTVIPFFFKDGAIPSFGDMCFPRFRRRYLFQSLWPDDIEYI